MGGMVIAIASLILTLAAIAYAWLRGGRPERYAAALLVAMIALQAAGHAFAPLIYKSVDPVGLAVDLVGLAGFSWLGISSRRIWPLWAGSLQLLSIGAHFVRALSIPVRPPVYYWMKSLPTVVVILLLILGTWSHQRRELQRKRSSSPS